MFGLTRFGHEVVEILFFLVWVLGGGGGEFFVKNPLFEI